MPRFVFKGRVWKNALCYRTHHEPVKIYNEIVIFTDNAISAAARLLSEGIIPATG